MLETGDEYLPYHKKYHAFWVIYGIGLPDDILKKMYYKNALHIIPNIDKTLLGEWYLFLTGTMSHCTRPGRGFAEDEWGY
jgi:hypothetical protein